MADFKEFFSKHAEEYSRSTSHASGKDLKILLEILSNRRYANALDIATGTGFTAIAISKLCDKVTALDPTSAMLDQARKNASGVEGTEKISFVEGRAESTGFPDESFDLITCRRAAHHFEDKLVFAREVARILKGSGLFALVDFVSPEQDSDRLLDELERIRDPSHVHAASETEWIGILENAGLKPLDISKDLDARTFYDWLYPVDPKSSEGMSSSDFVSLNTENLIRAGVWDPNKNKLLKQRMILIAGKKITE